MAQFGKLNFDDHIKGTTKNSVQFTIVTGVTPVNLTGAIITLTAKGASTYVFSTANSKINITNAVSGVFQFVEQIINMQIGNYTYDILIVFPTGVSKIWITGNWKILKNITNG